MLLSKDAYSPFRGIDSAIFLTDTMSMSGTRNQRLSQAGQLPVDRSLIVHRFPDRWSIRHLQTRGDEHREGELMRHCWSHIDKVDPEGQGHPDRYLSMCFRPEGVPVDITAYFAEPLDSPKELEDRSCCYSLRDPDNLPRASFYLESHRRYVRGHWKELGLRVHNVRGHTNSVPRSEYVSRVKEWTVTLPGAVWYGGGWYLLEPLTPLAVELSPRKRLKRAG